MSGRTTAVLFQTHFFDRWAERAFNRLRARAPAHHRFFVVMRLDAGAPVPERLRAVPHHIVRTPDIHALPYPLKAVATPGWNLWHDGHTDLIMLHFCRAHPDYDRYWQVEYDVAYSSPWHRFFAAFEDDESDLLATVVFRRRDYPDWLFWPSLVAAGEAPDDQRALRSFMPIFRASGALVRAVDAAYREGWGGHMECTWATIAAMRGLAVGDLGGDGEFAAARNRGRFYCSTPSDMYLSPGTMVFKPALFRPGSSPDMLWHPVKPFWLWVESRQAVLAGRSQVAGLVRREAPGLLPARWRTPGSFSRPHMHASLPVAALTAAVDADGPTDTPLAGA